MTPQVSNNTSMFTLPGNGPKTLLATTDAKGEVTFSKPFLAAAKKLAGQDLSEAGTQGDFIKFGNINESNHTQSIYVTERGENKQPYHAKYVIDTKSGEVLETDDALRQNDLQEKPKTEADKVTRQQDALSKVIEAGGKL